MNQPAHPLRQFFLALLAAVWIHVGLIFIFVLLLIFEVLGAKEIVAEPLEEEEQDDYSELTLTFEEDVVPVVPVDDPQIAPEPPKPEPKETGQRFARTSEEQEAAVPPLNTEILGERDTRATSDKDAEAGDMKQPSLSGEEEKKFIDTFDSQFTDGETVGPKDSRIDPSVVDIGEDLKTEEKQEQPKEVMDTGEDLLAEEKQDEFVDIDGVIRKIDDVLNKKEQKPDERVSEKPEKTVAEKKKAASRDGGFNSETSKTRVRGVISAEGIGALDVKNTAVGAYASNIFKGIEREWRMGSVRYRSVNFPGQVTLYFVVDKKGRVSKQSQLDMQGASTLQWSVILNSLRATKIPPMPKKVIEELQGKDLELTLNFTYL